MYSFRSGHAWIVPLLLAGLLTGCGASSAQTGTSGSTLHVTPTVTPSPTVTPTPAPIAVPTIAAAQISGPCKPRPGDTTPRYQIGDLVVDIPAFATLANPSVQIPDGTPARPLLLRDIPREPPTNPQLGEGGGGYVTSICNASPTHTHVLQSFDLRIAAFTPYTGQLNAWDPCSGGAYTRAMGVVGGCGGAFRTDLYVHATFPSGAAAGATVAAPQIVLPLDNSLPQSRLPLTLSPGTGTTPNVGISFDATAPPGVYTFALGVAVDDAAPSFVALGKPVLLAPVVRSWSGKACTAPAMLAQIPATSTDAYVCPEA